MRGALQEFTDLMDQAAAAAGMPAPEEGREQALRCLLGTWVQARDVATSLARLHAATPVHAVLVVNDHLAPHRSLVEEARKLAIPSFYVEHGFQFCGIEGRHFRLPRQKTLPSADFVFVENELDRAYYEEFYGLRGGSRPRIIRTGSALDEKSVVKESGLAPSGDPKTSRVLFCPAWVEAGTIQWVLRWDLQEHRAFSDFCGAILKLKREFPERRFELIVKLHPTLTKAIGTDPSGYYRGRAAEFGLDCVVDDGPIGKWLSGADLQVSTMPSSVQWESFLHGVPSAAYIGAAWDTTLKDFPVGVDTLITRWGAQEMLWDGCDWAGKLESLLRKKWSGEIGRIRDGKLKEIEQVPTAEAARRIREIIQDPASAAPLEMAAPKKENGKMRILEIVHAFPPADFGGTELYTLSLARALGRQGHEVHVLYPYFDPAGEPFSFTETRYEDVTVIRFNAVQRMSSPGLELHADTYHPAFRRFLSGRKYDLCHFQHLLFLSPSWPQVARDLGIKTVLKIDDMYFTCMRVHLNRPDGSYCSGPESTDKCVACAVEGTVVESPKRWGWVLLSDGAPQGHPSEDRGRIRFHPFRLALPGRPFPRLRFRQSQSPPYPHRHQSLPQGPEGPFSGRPGAHRLRRPCGSPQRDRDLPGRGRAVPEDRGFRFAVVPYLRRDGWRSIRQCGIHPAPGRDAERHLSRSLHSGGTGRHLRRPGPDGRALARRELSFRDSGEALTAGLPVAATRIAGVPEIIKPDVNGFLFDFDGMFFSTMLAYSVTWIDTCGALSTSCIWDI